MRALIFALIVIFIALLLGFAVIALLRFLNKDWWRHRIVKIISYGLIVWGLISIAAWVTGYMTKTIWLSNWGSLSTVIMLTISLALIITLPFSGFFNWLNRKLDKRHKDIDSEGNLDKRRRLFIKGMATIFPAASVLNTGAGVSMAFRDTHISLIPLEFENLPEELEGFRILHLTDSHLGIYKKLSDLENIIQHAGQFKPDLTLYTGDISDDIKILDDALKIVASLKPNYGTYAALGNHEYYRGIDSVLRAFERSEVELLKDSGKSLNLENSNLFLSGADDPKVMGQDMTEFHRRSVRTALDGAPSDAFHILMSHRPEGFDAAAEEGIDLTLSGHTHGGQVGLNGQSFWSMFMPGRYLWGHYERRKAQMYVSAGIGHWFPFRLGCPSEAPVIELKRKA